MTVKQLIQPSLWSASVLQLLLPLGLYLGYTSNADWHWWSICAFFYMVIYSMIGNNIALHRYFSHGHFTVSRPIEWFLLWSGCMIGLGGPMSYAMTHLVHHKYPDTELDPHGPVRGKRSIVVWFHQVIDYGKTPIHSRHILDLRKRYGWMHRYYWIFVLGNAGVMYLIDYKLFLFCWFSPASLTIWGVAGALLTQHWSLTANNGWHHKWFLWYEALHKNHHDYPRAPNTAINPNELDTTYQFSRLFFPKFNWEGQPK